MVDSKARDLSDSLDQIKRIERISSSMETLLQDSLCVLDQEKLKLYTSYLEKFQALCLQKLDSATVSTLRFVDNIINDRYEIQIEDLKRWLQKSRNIQWDYKNIVKRKGQLERLK
jgi:DNA mismatch repair ATPase MutS